MTVSQESSKLFRLLSASSLDVLLVKVVSTGELFLRAYAPDDSDSVNVRLSSGQTANLIGYAPFEWWKTSADLTEAVSQGWLLIPEDQTISTPVESPPEPLVFEDHHVIAWRPTSVPPHSPPDHAWAHFNETDFKVRVSESRRPYRNLVRPVDVAPILSASTAVIDLDPNAPTLRTIQLTGSVAFTATAVGPGRKASVRIEAGDSARGLAFPSTWRFVGRSNPPGGLAEGQTAVLSVVCLGPSTVLATFHSSADSEVVDDSQLISVTDDEYGAVGDGVTDDREAIQAALTAAGALYTATGTRQRVYVPAGIYLVSKSPTLGHFCLSVPSGVHLWGPGRIKMADEQIAQVRLISVEDARDVIIEGLTLDGNHQNQSTDPSDPKKHAIFVRGSSHCLFTGIRFVNVDGDGVYFGTNSGPDPRAHHCIVENFWMESLRRSLVTITSAAHHIIVRYGYGVGWSGDQSAALNIETDTSLGSPECHFDSVWVDDPAPEGAHVCFGVTFTQGNNSSITRCRLPSSIFVVASNDVDICDNIIDNPGSGVDFGNGGHSGSAGIIVRTEVNRVRILRNYVSVGSPSSGDTFDVACIVVWNTGSGRPKDVIIGGNVCTPNGRYGIHTTGLAGVTLIRDNYIHGQGLAAGGIYCFTPNNAYEDVIIRGNTIRNTAAVDGAIAFTCTAPGAANGFKRILVEGNRIIDDQAIPTCTDVIKFFDSGGAGFGDVVLKNNQWTSNIVRGIVGLGYWRVGGNYDGTANTSGQFEGVGVPAIVAGVGSTFKRTNGGAGSSFYVKESSSGSSNWVAK